MSTQRNSTADKRQKNQYRLAFPEESRGAAPTALSLVRMVHDLAEYLRGWIGYFGRCETPDVLDKLEKWLRRRLRSMVWKQWKRGTTRYR
jgi:hypothetical protein